MTTEAGKRLLKSAEDYGGEVYFDEPGRWEAVVAAIEAEAWEKGYGDGVIEAQRREVESIPDYQRTERARLRERVEGLPQYAFSLFDDGTDDRLTVSRAAVLAILEEE